MLSETEANYIIRRLQKDQQLDENAVASYEGWLMSASKEWPKRKKVNSAIRVLKERLRSVDDFVFRLGQLEIKQVAKMLKLLNHSDRLNPRDL